MKRRGFTLIELMVVIAIIIILAAIAIPNYLQMTARAKRSRLASDYATLATVLETYKTDWSVYPIATSGQDVSLSTTTVYMELAGTATSGKNISANTNAVGQNGPIEYCKAGTLASIKNPFDSTKPVYYLSSTSGTAGWVIYADIGTTAANYLYRTSSMSTVSESTTSAITVPAS